MKRSGWIASVLALAVGTSLGFVALEFDSFRLPEIPEKERLAALARIAANVIKSAAPQDRAAHVRLVQALPHDNTVEAEFRLDAETAAAFQSRKIGDIEATIIANMCQSNLGSGFHRGLIVHSVYTDPQGIKLSDFRVDKLACSAFVTEHKSQD
jgi:hypothetical protein